jgi:ribosomal protein S18 acetylase RimI-like enzyme
VINVREARPGDGALLVVTTEALAAFHGNAGKVKATAERFEQALFCEDPIIGALIAEHDGALAGAVVWHRSFSTNAGHEIMYMEDICVLPEFRSKGVGKALMRATAELALARGYDAIFWLAMSWNERALAFYRECGAEVEEAHNVCRIKGDALKALAA